ncbi:MAG: ATP-binding protein [Candidatus Saccharimonadaceae bacterium]
MTPLRLSYIWYRRLYVALFVSSLTYVVLYALPVLDLQYIPEPVHVDIIPAIGGALVAIASIVLFINAKKTSSFIPSYVTFGVFALATAYLVQVSGGVNSSFLPLWALTIFIAPIFGAYGWLPALVIASSYIASEYLEAGLTTQTIILVIMSSLVPLIAGIVLWRETPDSEEQSSKNVKHLASQLSEVATKSEIVINAIGDGVIAVDGKGIIQLINPAAQEILGWGKQDALMLSYKSIFKLSDVNGTEVDSSQDPIEQVLNTNQQARSNKLTAVTNSGKKLSVAIVASPIGERGSGVIAVFRDTTNERAEEREQAEFISTASHEMRTPVASIEGYLGLALNPATATIDAKARDFIMKAHEAAEHLGRLFQDLLDVSKSEDGRMTSAPRVVDIVPFTQTIVQGLRQKATDKGLTLVFTPEEGSNAGQGIKKLMPVYFVNLDNDHIREVLDNLIENAIKYTPQGEVRVDLTGNEDKVVISIKDTGLGIPTEDISHLFQKFYRVDNVDRQAIGGTGLGLYLSRRLVEAMEGRLWVESVFGSSSTFFVELPRIDTQEAGRLKEEQERLAKQTATMQLTPPISAPVPQTTTAKPIPVTYAETISPVAQPTPPTLAPQQAPIQQIITRTQLTSQPTPAPIQIPTPPVAPLGSQGVKPATTVPRGESLSREQINERVRQLEAMAQQQRGSVTPPVRQ